MNNTSPYVAILIPIAIGIVILALLPIFFSVAILCDTPALKIADWLGIVDCSMVTGKQNVSGDGFLSNVSDIPESLKSVFEAAGAKYKVSPAFIAAIFWKEHGKSFPTQGPWASSPAGANGPFQFIEKTWEGWSCKKTNNSDGVFETNPAKICGYGQDGDGDNKADVQNLYDSGFAAAELLGKNGASPYTTDLDKLRDVASRYNSGLSWEEGKGIPETADYVPDVLEAYQKFLALM